MVVENLLCKYDKNKIRIISGDIENGLWTLDGFSLVPAKGSAINKRIDLEQRISNIQLRDAKPTNSTGSILGAGVGALAGLRYYGVVGAIGGAFAGHFIGGGQTEVCVDIELTDGRKFAASMSPTMCKRLSAIANRA